MIIHISRTRIMKYTVISVLTIILWCTIATFVTHQVEDSTEGQVITTFKFLAPMKPSTAENLIIKRADSGKKVSFKYHWITANTLRVLIDEKTYPRGHRYTYCFKAAPVMIWPFHVWASGDFFSEVNLRLLGIKNSEAVPSRGPILLQFNTFVDPREIKKFVQLPMTGKLEPLKYKVDSEQLYIDYSQWQYIPTKKLKNQYKYTIIICKGLPSSNGNILREPLEAHFKTTSEFLITQANPRPGSQSIWLTRSIILQTNQRLVDCKIEVPGLEGKTKIIDNQVEFIPHRVMMSGKKYKVKAHLISTSNENLDYEFSFSTTDLGNNKWLELKLGQTPSLWLLEGSNTIKKMEVSLKSSSPIPKGTLYEENRNSVTTNSPCWVKLNADILLHATPMYPEDDHKLQKLPETYSCIYLNKQDIKDLCNSLPKGVMLISH